MSKLMSMGHIPSTEDRTPYSIRRAYLESLTGNGFNVPAMYGHTFGKPLINAFENEFKGNNIVGYKFSNIISMLIDDYDLWLKSPRNYSLGFWFDNSALASVYFPNQNVSQTYPFSWSNAINADSRYLPFVRSDKKLAPISIAIATTTTTTDGYTSLFYFLKELIINGAGYTPVNLSANYTFPTSNSNAPRFNAMTPAGFVANMREFIKIVQFLESEVFSFNISGNIDEKKLNEYETILGEQLNYLNGLTDKVQMSLISEKIEGQAVKDNLIAQIEEKKKVLAKVIEDKKNLIRNMKATAQQYASTFPTR